jgi:hypothetical protein
LIPARTSPSGARSAQDLIERGPEERAVSLFHQDRIGWIGRKLRDQLAPLGSFDRDADSLGPHLGKGVAQVRPEFLAHPDDRPLVASHDADERVDRPDQPSPPGGRPGSQKVIQHVDDDQRRTFHDGSSPVSTLLRPHTHHGRPEFQGIAGRTPGSACTSSRNLAPRTSKLGYWSNDAQAGESSTTGSLTLAALASRAAAPTARSRVSQVS